VRRLTGLVENLSRLKVPPEQEQRDFYQPGHRQRISTCQPKLSPHDGQYTSRVERLALKPAGAPHPDGKMQLPLLYRLTRRPRPASTSCTSIPGCAEAYFVTTSGKAASMNCGVAPIRSTPASPPA
jgi:hypothetical protein